MYMILSLGGDDSNFSYKSQNFIVEEDGSAKVEMEENFIYRCYFKNLEDQFLSIVKIKLYSEKSKIKPISQIMIDLFTLAVGPQHCELELKNIQTMKTTGRIIFDIEFQQLQDVVIELRDLTCKVDGKDDRPLFGVFKAITQDENISSNKTSSLFGDYDKDKNKTEFNWNVSFNLYEDPSLQMLATIDNIKQGTVQICLYQDRQCQRSDQKKKEKQEQSDSSSEEEIILDKIKLQQKSKSPNRKTPKKDILRRKTVDPIEYYKQFKVELSENPNQDIVGECYIGFLKLLRTELRLFDKKDSLIFKNSLSISKQMPQQHFASQHNIKQNNDKEDERQIQIIQQQSRQQIKKFKEQLMMAGKVIGQIRGSFKISNTPIFQQMTLGVLTEKGIFMTQAPVISDQEQNLFFFRKSKMSQNLNDLVKQISKLKQYDQLKGKKAQKSQTEKELVLRDLISILQSSEDQSSKEKIFLYDNRLILVKAQECLLELGSHCLLYANNAKYDQKHYYYQILVQIFQRGELRLSNIGFLGDQQHEGIMGFDSETLLQQGIDKEQLQLERQKVAKFYLKLLYQTLDDSIQKFCRKGLEPFLKQYVEHIFSVAYFRIPNFRKLFLECILKKSNETIPEWNNAHWSLDNKEIDDDSAINHIMDWENHFYAQIQNCSEKKEADAILRRVLVNDKWQMKFSKRTIAFFQIVSRLADKVNAILMNYQKMNIIWHDIPGYSIILKSFLLEMKELDIIEYPDSLIEATMNLMNYPQLITVFITIIFKKTNAYDSNCLCATLDLTAKWFSLLEKREESLPSNFDFNFFFKGIQIALEIDHSVTVTKTLWLLYKTMHLYPFEQRSYIVNELIKKNFYKFMFHWCYNVREMYLMLLFYQIQYNFIYLESIRLQQNESSKSGNHLTLEEINQKSNQKLKRSDSPINLEKYINDLKQILDPTQNNFEQELPSSQPNFLKAVSSPVRRPSARDRNRKLAYSLIKTHKTFSKKLQELSILENCMSMQNGTKSIQKEAEYNFSDDEKETASHQDKTIDEKEIAFNKIYAKIPQELQVYVQKKVFEQYHKEIKQYEEWKNALQNQEKVTLPNIDVDHLIPLDDIFQEGKTSEDW